MALESKFSPNHQDDIDTTHYSADDFRKSIAGLNEALGDREDPAERLQIQELIKKMEEDFSTRFPKE